MMGDRVARVRYGVLLLVVVLLPVLSAQNARRDSEIYQWSGTQWTRVDGTGVRISVGPNGQPWVVKANGDVFRRVRDGYRQVPGMTAIDIGVGGDGSAWIVGTDNFVYRWTGRIWESVQISAVAISVDEDGDPWIVSSSGQISRWDGDQFVRVPGSARDIGAESSVWIVARDGGIQELQSNGRFSPSRGGGVHVSAGANGAAWVTNEANEVYRWTGGAFERMPGAASDVGVNARGEVFVIGTPVTGPPPPRDDRRAQPRRR